MRLVSILLVSSGWLIAQTAPQALAAEETRVVIESGGWQLVGDLRLPGSGEPVPAVLLLNKAAGDRSPYKALADQLAQRNIASLRLDLRAHGESTNLGRFIPGDEKSLELLADTDFDVIAAHRYLKSHSRIDSDHIGIVGSSYSGEYMAVAGRSAGYAQAYVALSPGSFSDESITAIDPSGIPWLFITSKNERYLKEITATRQKESQEVELLIVPGRRHATDLLDDHPDLSERIAVWLAHELR
jgi:dienelactone hydrolase